MGPKRKAKQKQQKQQKQKPVKKTKPKQTSKPTQPLLHHYFPNICTNKQKAYSNILKKPNNIIKQQKKLSKQLLTEQTLIIKQMNSLFHGVFKQVDHEVVNWLGEKVLMMRVGWVIGGGGADQKKQCNYGKVNPTVNINDQQKCSIVMKQQINLNQQSFQSSSSQSTVTVQCLKQISKTEQQNIQQSNTFLVNLQQYRYDNYTPSFAQSRSQHVIKTISEISDKPTFNNNSLSQPLLMSNTKQKERTQIQQRVVFQQQNECENSVTVTLTNHAFLQRLSINQSIHNKFRQSMCFNNDMQNHGRNQVQNQPIQLKQQKQAQKHFSPIHNIQYNQTLFIQNNQPQQQQYTQNNNPKQNLTQLEQKLKTGINNIFNLIQKKQLKKQQAIKFKKYVTQLKKEQSNLCNTFKNDKFCLSKDRMGSSFQEQQITQFDKNLQQQSNSNNQQEIDHDQIAFSQINYFMSNHNQNINKHKLQQQSKNLDILDCILSRHYIPNSAYLKNDFLQTSTQIYYQNQDLCYQTKHTITFEDQTSTNQTGGDSTEKQNQNNYHNGLHVRKLQQPLFQLPQQFLTGYSKQYMNQDFFKRIHQCQLQKVHFIHAVEQNLI